MSTQILVFLMSTVGGSLERSLMQHPSAKPAISRLSYIVGPEELTLKLIPLPQVITIATSAHWAKMKQLRLGWTQEIYP
jgi:hypothetical protein